MQRDPERETRLASLRGLTRVRMLRQATGLSHDFAHIERVWRNCRIIEHHARHDEGWELDGDVLEVAALLHEIGRGAENDGETPGQASVRIAEELLRAEGLDALVWPACDAIMAQERSQTRAPRTLEGKVLADARTLDALGAVGVTRTLIEGAYMAPPALYDGRDPRGEERELDPTAYLIDRFPAHVFPQADTTYSAFAREEAERRMRIVRAFYSALLQEAGLY